MWIFANNVGFLSIVQDRDDASQLCVRARNSEHLVKAFGNVINEGDILETPDGDYRWRVTVDRDLVMQLVAECVEEIDYDTNVKGTISSGDKKLSQAMMTCWFAMCRYQDGTMLEGDYDDLDAAEQEDDFDDPEEDGPVVATVPARRASELTSAMSEAVASIEDDFESDVNPADMQVP